MAVPHYLPHPPDEAKPPSGILMKKFNASQAAQTAKVAFASFTITDVLAVCQCCLCVCS